MGEPKFEVGQLVAYSELSRDGWPDFIGIVIDIDDCWNPSVDVYYKIHWLKRPDYLSTSSQLWENERFLQALKL